MKRNRTTRLFSPTRNSRSGQAIVFLIMVVVVLFFVVLWNFDLHKILRVKLMSQNAGDAAALAAARWQGTTLNLIGDLNLMHVLALSANDRVAEESITNIQARLCFVGPMIGFMASQQAAKQNQAYQNDGFTELVREHARAVRVDYPSRTAPNGDMLFPEPYTGAWSEYADMLDLIASDGVAAGPDNARYFTDPAGNHILLSPDFYDAIAGRNWCWFHHHAPTLLQDYRNFFPCWWPPLPDIPHGEYINCEFFGLGLARAETAFRAFTGIEAAKQMAAGRGLSGNINETGMTTRATWYCYGGAWSGWNAMSLDGSNPFPATGKVRPEFDYAGADAATRIEAPVARLTPAGTNNIVTNTITWTAAAKPFGYLEGQAAQRERPNSLGVVLPAFHEVRLIPVDASSAPAAGSYNLEWRRHMEIHLPDYMQNGPPSYSCYYCRQLQTWENPVFRQEGVDWLSTNSASCDQGGGPGGGGGGGSRRGH